MSHFALTVATSLGDHYPGFILSQCRINPPRPQEFLAVFSSLSLLIFSLIAYFLCGRSHFMFVLAQKCRELLQMRQSQTLSWLFTPTSMLLLRTSFSYCTLRICLILYLSSHVFHLLALKSIHLFFIVPKKTHILPCRSDKSSYFLFSCVTSCTIAVEVNVPRMQF